MVVIASTAFGASYAADTLVIERTNMVAGAAALVCAFLGTVYARAAHKAAFPLMVPGILFLVPSGLALSGGITAEPDIVALGHAVISTSIGITGGGYPSPASLG
jgi:uncharacterized membrane protein YjjB (DUF3815 family)